MIKCKKIHYYEFSLCNFFTYLRYSLEWDILGSLLCGYINTMVFYVSFLKMLNKLENCTLYLLYILQVIIDSM